MMTDFVDRRRPAADSAFSNCGSVNPPRPSVPILKKFRRFNRSQKELELDRPCSVSMDQLPRLAVWTPNLARQSAANQGPAFRVASDNIRESACVRCQATANSQIPPLIPTCKAARRKYKTRRCGRSTDALSMRQAWSSVLHVEYQPVRRILLLDPRGQCV